MKIIMDLREYAKLNYIKMFLLIFEKTNSMKVDTH